MFYSASLTSENRKSTILW